MRTLHPPRRACWVVLKLPWKPPSSLSLVTQVIHDARSLAESFFKVFNFSSWLCQRRLLQAIAVIDTGVHFPCCIPIKLCLQSILWHNYSIIGISSFSSRHLGCPFPLYVVHKTVSSVSKNVVDITSFRHSYCPLIHSCFFLASSILTDGFICGKVILPALSLILMHWHFYYSPCSVLLSNSEIRRSLEIGIASLAEVIFLRLSKICTIVSTS